MDGNESKVKTSLNPKLANFVRHNFDLFPVEYMIK